jgi:thiol-disulfide isomerase/thioredoxin
LATAAAGLAALAPSLAGAQVAADAVLRAFHPTSEYRLLLAGKAATAEIYDSQLAGALLILSSSLSSPVILNKRGGQVGTVHVMKVAKRPDGSVDLLADAELADLGHFRLQGEDVVFTVDGREARLAPSPPLIGVHPRSDLVSHSPEYLRDAEAYSPDPAVLSSLRRQGQPVVVRIFFGSWCPHCKEKLPHVLKVEQALSGSKIAFEYYGLPKPPQAWSDREATRLQVREVPTGIVYVAGREIGRIQRYDWDRVEATLASLLEKARAAS